eukprot:806136-Rhodomonas_salina.1
MQFLIGVPVSAPESEEVQTFTLVVALELCAGLFLVWFCDELYLYEPDSGRLERSVPGSTVALFLA